MITQEELDEIMLHDLIDFKKPPCDSRVRAYKQLDVYMYCNVAEGFKYMKPVLFLNDVSVIYSKTHYYAGSTRFVGLDRCSHILDLMQKFVRQDDG
jgi:hypothetical protein